MKNMEQQKFLGIITARGGSKGIPGKNIKNLLGKPLIAWTIERALECEYLEKIIVSTDDDEIAEISKKYGAEVPFKRPNELAEDTTPTWPVLQHALKFMEDNLSQSFRGIVLLQPTSPLREKEDIDGCIETFLKNDCEAVISVCESLDNPYFNMMEANADGFLDKCKKANPIPTRRQDAPPVFISNGAVYVFDREAIWKEKQADVKKILPFLMPREKSLDIDDKLDWEKAVFQLSQKHYEN
jgi:CMP-N,N'-diacetyllegionaminic acid synthase